MKRNNINAISFHITIADDFLLVKTHFSPLWAEASMKYMDSETLSKFKTGARTETENRFYFLQAKVIDLVNTFQKIIAISANNFSCLTELPQS